MFVYKDNKEFYIDSDWIDSDLEHNINKVFYDDFMRIVSTVVSQIEEGKYKKYEREVD